MDQNYIQRYSGISGVKPAGSVMRVLALYLDQVYLWSLRTVSVRTRELTVWYFAWFYLVPSSVTRRLL